MSVVIPEFSSQESRGRGRDGFPPTNCGNDISNTGITQKAKHLRIFQFKISEPRLGGDDELLGPGQLGDVHNRDRFLQSEILIPPNNDRLVSLSSQQNP